MGKIRNYYLLPQVLASEKSVEKLQKDVDYANSLINKAQKKAQKEITCCGFRVTELLQFVSSLLCEPERGEGGIALCRATT